MSTEPLVSAVIPVLNGEHHIEALHELRSRPDVPEYRGHVSGNASTDRTAETARSFDDPRVRILLEPAEQLSLHASWARALAAAKGDLVKIVCHDDLLLPDCLAVQTELLLRHPTAVVASGQRRIIDDEGDVLIKARGLGHLTKPGGTQVMDGGAPARACTRAGATLPGEPVSMPIRRSVLPEPLFDPCWHYTTDIDFYMRSLQRRDAVLNRRVLCCFRVSPHQLSAALATGQARELRAFFSELERLYPDQVSDPDVRLGTTRARLSARARRVPYEQMRMRATIARWRDPEGPRTEPVALSISNVSSEHR